MNVAEYLVKKLEELGINDFFGLPGDYNFNILYAIEDNYNTNWIGCTNELNAGYAADGYARQRGYGALVTTYGVGELSAINAIAGSYAENIPVITIIGTPSTKCINDKTLIHHNFNDINPKAFEEAHKPVVATTAFLTRDNAKMEIDRVLKVFVRDKKPVYIAIPMDITTQEISERNVDYEWTSSPDVLEEVVDKIITKINSATSPVILGDTLVKRFDARLEFKEFVAKSGIPTTNFLMGTNLIESNIENYIGTYFNKYRNPISKKLLETTDCLIAVGAIYSDLNAFGFSLPYKINSQIAIYGTYTYIENVRYDNVKMSEVLEKLSTKIERKNYQYEKPKLGFEKSIPINNQLNSDYIYPRLQEFLKPNDIIVAETGLVPLGISQITFPQNAELHTQTLWGSIGWATPATLGVGIANPNSRVILITGEGSHQLTALEVGNMLRRGIKPVVIVINNNGYTIERLLSNSPEDKFNDIMQMNYSKFARVFEGDIWSTRVTTADDFDKALKVTQIMNKLCYIEVCVDSSDMPILAKDLINDLKNKSSKSQMSIPEDCYENFETASLSNSEGMTYGTTVHESLREEDY